MGKDSFFICRIYLLSLKDVTNMQSTARTVIETSWTLLRVVAVISSSIATILSSMLPLIFHSNINHERIFLTFILVSFGALIIHGALTHLYNDYADYLSGTDARSPAILSGGSRVIQRNLLSPYLVHQLATHLTISLFIVALVFAMTGYMKLTLLILIGIWAAYSYSMPPLRLSYRPFIGEGLSLFPAIFFLGVAIPWLLLDTIPLWVYQNTIINAFICMAWVMVHHIPDVQADQQANPIKRTSVVWFVEKFGRRAAVVPAIIYLILAAVVALTLFYNRFWHGLIVVLLLAFMARLVMKIDVENVQNVTQVEKLLLISASIIAILLVIWI